MRTKKLCIDLNRAIIKSFKENLKIKRKEGQTVPLQEPLEYTNLSLS